jgi:hypothetical protein
MLDLLDVIRGPPLSRIGCTPRRCADVIRQLRVTNPDKLNVEVVQLAIVPHGPPTHSGALFTLPFYTVPQLCVFAPWPSRRRPRSETSDARREGSDEPDERSVRALRGRCRVTERGGVTC